jgi:hypothetical protein
MKPIAHLNRLPATESWQRQPRLQNALLHRIRNVSRAIHSIQEEMHAELTESASGNRLAGFFEDTSAVKVVNDFKAELDQLRRIVWFYLEEASAKPRTAHDSEQHNRLQRVNELLRALSPPVSSATIGEAVKPSVSFFERLDVVIDTYMQEKKPITQAKAAKTDD